MAGHQTYNYALIHNMITHNTYFNDRVQSLGFTMSDHAPATLGVVSPGEVFDFGTTRNEEHFVVISGSLIINNVTYKETETCTVPAEHPIVITTPPDAKHESAYLCIYR